MRYFLALLLMVISCRAASPSFSSFNTNQFSTNNLFISIKDGASVTNITNTRSGASSPSSVATLGDLLWRNVASIATLTNTMEGAEISHDVSAGDDDDIYFDLFATVDGTFNDYGNLYVTVSTNNAQLNLTTTAAGTESGVKLLSGDSSTSLRMEIDGTAAVILNPSVASGAAVAHIIGTSSSLTTGDKLTSIRNAGVEQQNTDYSGGIMVGAGAEAVYGATADGATLIGIRDTSVGDSDFNELWLESVNGTNSWHFQAFGQASAGSNNIEHSLTRAGVTYTTTSALGPNDTRFQVAGEGAGASQALFQVYPDITSTGSAIALNLQTSESLISGDALALMRNAGTIGFRVDGVSGYTGAGTLFLSDDGTYKAAGGGGGDSIWTNITGYVTLNEFQAATNTLAFTSGASDNATNILFNVDSANYLSASGTLLQRLANGGTNQNRIDTFGGIHLGPNSTPNLGFYSITERRDRTAEANVTSGLAFEIYDSGDATVLDNATVFLDSGYVQGYFRTAADATDRQVLEWELYSGQAMIRLVDQNIDRWRMEPTVASSGTAVAYKFDTSNALTNGDKFVSIQNAGTEVLNISPNSTGAQIVFGPGSTNVLGRSGNNLVYTNSATAADVQFRSVNGSGNYTAIGTDSGGNPTVTASTTTLYLTQSGGQQVFLNNGAFGTALGSIDLGQSGSAWKDISLTNRLLWQITGVSTNLLFDSVGVGSPEGAVSALPGSIYRNSSGGALTTLWVKESGTGNTGWVAK